MLVVAKHVFACKEREKEGREGENTLFSWGIPPSFFYSYCLLKQPEVRSLCTHVSHT